MFEFQRARFSLKCNILKETAVPTYRWRMNGGGGGKKMKDGERDVHRCDLIKATGILYLLPRTMRTKSSDDL